MIETANNAHTEARTRSLTRSIRWTTCIAIGALALVLMPVTAYAVTDWYEDWIVWTPGLGQKDQVNCANGYYAFAIENVDETKNTVDNNMKCGNISDYVPPSMNVHTTDCVNVSVQWTAGAGLKKWSHCPNGKYAVGFSIYDYGNRNEGINNMRCCALAGGETQHTSSYSTTVSWTPGAGEKGYTECDLGSLITGIRLKDYGNNNQAVFQIECSFIDF
jgi:hypothetical protein